MIGSGAAAQTSLKLLAQKTLAFPSASGIEFYKDKLYIFGDNATNLLILSADYAQSDSVDYWRGSETVIEKEDKPDIESAMIVTRDKEPVLYGVGSMSDRKRWRVFEFSLDDLTFKKTHFFKKEDLLSGLQEVNIEGSAEVGPTVVLCNRANDKTKQNHLLFWNWKDSLITKEISLPKSIKTAGMSGLYYVKEKDLLLFTASEEATANAVADGEIGDSYLGWITEFSTKMTQPAFIPDGYLPLGKASKALARQKIESVCVEKVSGNHYILHLVADNDNNQSHLFKLELTLSK